MSSVKEELIHAVVYVDNKELAGKIQAFLTQEGHLATGSTVEISSGTHGVHSTCKIDVTPKPLVAQCMSCKASDIEIFEQEMCISCYTDEVLLVDYPTFNCTECHLPKSKREGGQCVSCYNNVKKDSKRAKENKQKCSNCGTASLELRKDKCDRCYGKNMKK